MEIRASSTRIVHVYNIIIIYSLGFSIISPPSIGYWAVSVAGPQSLPVWLITWLDRGPTASQGPPLHAGDEPSPLSSPLREVDDHNRTARFMIAVRPRYLYVHTMTYLLFVIIILKDCFPTVDGDFTDLHNDYDNVMCIIMMFHVYVILPTLCNHCQGAYNNIINKTFSFFLILFLFSPCV